MNQKSPEYLVEMARRPVPTREWVVAGSTPVVSFGDLSLAEVATLGINPSKREFVDVGGTFLGNDTRRLSTLESLGSTDAASLTEAQVHVLIEDCNRYFQRNPYSAWFDPLDQLLQEGVGASYYDGTACHLDLVQWATDPVWGKIPDASARIALLSEGVPHLRAQLQTANVRLVLLNGRQVIQQVKIVALASLTLTGRLPLGRAFCDLFEGEGQGLRFLGWSTNLQSSWGVSKAFKDTLAGWLADRSK